MANSQLIDAALDLAWRHWGALGVRSSVHGAEAAVDLEALIHFTLRLVEIDPRLADEVRDWLEQYNHYVSGPRLNALARVFDTPPGALEALRTRSLTRKDYKSSLTTLDTPARSLLRLRSIFGGNARADVLLYMLTSGESSVTALGLTPLGISKRTAAEVLEGLALGGITAARLVGNRLVHTLAHEERLRAVLGPVPDGSGHWHLRLPLAAQFIAMSERVRGKEPIIQAAATRKLLDRFDAVISDPALAKPPSTSVETHFARITEWISGEVLAEPSFINRTFGGAIEGKWLGSNVDHVSHPGRPDGALLPRIGAEMQREFLCLDLVHAGVVGRHDDWIWGVLSTAAEDRYVHSKGIARGDAWRFVSMDMSSLFDVRKAEPLPPQQIAKFYGAEAARRARSDRPAVQYRVGISARTGGIEPL